VSGFVSSRRLLRRTPEGDALLEGDRPPKGDGEGERQGGDRGAASILVLALGLLMVAAGIAGAAIGNARVARHRAQNAADLGALAGAMRAVHGKADACARAGWFVAANGARMTECTVGGLEIVVRVRVEVRPLPGFIRQAEAEARAGPVYALPS
jgi:secretion/DNA translocation related TadE-like protein